MTAPHIFSYRGCNGMKQFLDRYFSVICICLGAVTVLLMGAYIEKKWFQQAAAASSVQDDSLVIVLDAGHGGMDGGATAKDGTIEKDINLAITLKLRDMLEASGYKVVLTRESDRSLHDESAGTVREIKTSDLKNRLALMNTYPACLFISIHQNHYTESVYSGAQIFYSPNQPESQVLAQTIQDLFHEKLQPQNNRQIKPAGKNLYLMWNAKVPAILAECGFLSNETETALLKEETYQQKVAFILYSGILSYLQSTTAQS